MLWTISAVTVAPVESPELWALATSTRPCGNRVYMIVIGAEFGLVPISMNLIQEQAIGSVTRILTSIKTIARQQGAIPIP